MKSSNKKENKKEVVKEEVEEASLFVVLEVDKDLNEEVHLENKEDREYKDHSEEILEISLKEEVASEEVLAANNR